MTYHDSNAFAIFSMVMLSVTFLVPLAVYGFNKLFPKKQKPAFTFK